MLYEGSTGQLFGVFTKAAEVHGCCICVGRAFRECYCMQQSREVRCQGVGEVQDVKAT